MAKMYKVFEGMRDSYPLAITEADALLLLHEEMIIDPYEYVEGEAAKRGSFCYSGLILEGMDPNSYLTLCPMEMIERRLNQYEHVDAEFIQS